MVDTHKCWETLQEEYWVRRYQKREKWDGFLWSSASIISVSVFRATKKVLQRRDTSIIESDGSSSLLYYAVMQYILYFYSFCSLAEGTPEKTGRNLLLKKELLSCKALTNSKVHFSHTHATSSRSRYPSTEECHLCCTTPVLLSRDI